MSELIDAVETFFSELAAVNWTAVGIALGLHLARLLCRAVAWRNIIAAALPESRVPLGGVTGAYLAGVGINAIAPARGGDVVRLVLAKNEIEGATYTTLAPTLVVETLLDFVLASAILGWALTQGALPGIHAVPDLPSVDWSWPFRNPRPTIVIAVVWLTVITLLVVIWSRKVRDFREQVKHGFAILREPRRFLREVVSWQLLSWAFRAAAVWFFLEAFHVPASVRNVLLVLSVQSLSTLLPFTPGGIGTQQGFLVYAFRDSGIAKTALVSFSVGMHIAMNACSALVGVIALFLVARTLRWKRVVEREQPEIEKARAGR